jgi:hypothetical protein
MANVGQKSFAKGKGIEHVQLREGVMRRETVITGLICLNLGLVAGLAYVWKQRAAGQAVSLPATSEQRSGDVPTARIFTRKLQSSGSVDQEFREIFRMRQQREDARMNVPMENNPESMRKHHEAHLQMENEIRTMLGDQRYAEYQRSQDWQFRNLTRLTRDNGLPSDTAVKAYDINQLAMQEATKIRSQPDLSREQRDAMLRQMQADLDSTMGRLLGPDVYTRFQQNYGGARIFSERRPAGVVVGPAPVPASSAVITVP